MYDDEICQTLQLYFFSTWFNSLLLFFFFTLAAQSQSMHPPTAAVYSFYLQCMIYASAWGSLIFGAICQVLFPMTFCLTCSRRHTL